MPEPCEKYLSLKLDAQKVGTEEYTEMSELMEDLYKILPLTVESDFKPQNHIVNCQFESASDLKLAKQILDLVLSTDHEFMEEKSEPSLLQKLLRTICCREPRKPCIDLGKITPVKEVKPSGEPRIYSSKKA